MEDSRIGRLLASLKLVKSADVENAARICEQTRLPIGKVLVMDEQLSNATLKSVVEAQWMLRDKLLTFDQVAEAVTMARRNNWLLADALIALEYDAYSSKGARLGELLLGAKVVDKETLSKMLNTASTSGLPLGRVLFLLDSLPEDILDLALMLQRNVRLGTINPETAHDELKRAKLQSPNVQHNGERLAELLVAFGLIKHGQVHLGTKMSKSGGKFAAEFLDKLSSLNAETIDALIVRLKPLLKQQQLSVNDALSVIRHISTDDVLVTEAFKRCRLESSDLEKSISLYELLRLAGIVDSATLQSLIKRILQDPELSSRVMSKASEASGSTLPSLKEGIKIAIRDSHIFAEILLQADCENKELIKFAQILLEQIRLGAIKLDLALIRLAYRHTFGLDP